MNDILNVINSDVLDIEFLKKKFYYIYKNDRIYLIRIMDNVEELSSIRYDLASFSNNKIKQKVIDEIKGNNRVKEFDINTFLWDLYFIIIYPIEDKENQISDEKINAIQRDKFIARKIVIQGNVDEIKNDLKRIFSEERELGTIINNVMSIFSNDKSQLIRNILYSDNSSVENEIKTSLNKTSDLKFNDVLSYLHNLQKEYKEIDE